MRPLVLALCVVGCTSALEPTDAGRDAPARDAPPRIDAWLPLPDAGPSHLAPAADARVVDSCASTPRLASRGDGWTIWWPYGCASARVVELDAEGATLATIPIEGPSLVDPFAPPVLFDAVTFAHGTYGLAARECAASGTPCSPDLLAPLARDGTLGPWEAMAPGALVGLAGWDDRADWLTVELRADGSGTTPTSVLRDASLAVVAENVIDVAVPAGDPIGAVYRTPDVALAWWGVTAIASGTPHARALAPDGTPLGAAGAFPWFLDDVDALGDVLVALDVQPYAAPAPPPRGIATIDPLTGAETARVPIAVHEPIAAPRLAVVSDDVVAVCWSDLPETTMPRLYVQIVDLATGARLGLPTLVASDALGGFDCGFASGRLIVVWAGAATQMRAYDVAF